jgi:UDP:flavonoid glycosyltransferase YjiC (YdhE family)
VHGDPADVVNSPAGQELLNTGKRPILLARRFTELLRPHWNLFVDEIAPIVESADMLVYSPLAFPVAQLAEARGTPAVLVTFQPLAATGRMGPVALGGRSLGPFNRPAHRAIELTVWMLVRSLVNEWRTSRLGLEALPITGPFRELERSGQLQLAAFSRYLCPRPDDWPSQVEVTGAWLPAPGGAAPPELADWLDGGPPPVYVGFGSMSAPNRADLAASIVEGIRRNGRRAVVHRGATDPPLRRETGPSDARDILELTDADHAWLFPRCAAIIHHGGAGTTATAAASGVPSIVVPFFADQPFWARRASQAGAAVATLDRQRLSVDDAARAVSEALDPAKAARAEALGRLIRAERGAERAALMLASDR